MTPNNSEIERQAAEWAAKSEHGRVPVGEQARFEQWLDADPRHNGAFMKALAVQIHLGKIGRAHASLAPKSLSRARLFTARRMVMTGAIAACMALIVAGSLLWNATNVADYATALGATRVVALPDGSTMTMNTGSAASMRYSYATRGIVLARGEALFDVAKHKSRPFDVTARNVKVRAVGTSFAVKCLENSPLEVVVREGVVVVSTNGSTLQLTANRRAVIDRDGKIKTEALSSTQVFNDLLWRKGYIFFNGSTLADAARQFSRYSPVRIVFADRAVANRSVSGLFKATDPGTFAKASSEALSLRLQQNGNTIHLSTNAD